MGPKPAPLGSAGPRFLKQALNPNSNSPQILVQPNSKNLFFSNLHSHTQKYVLFKSVVMVWQNNQIPKIYSFQISTATPKKKKKKNPIFQSSNPEITKPTEEISDQTKNKYKEEDKNRNGERRESWP
ncbi:hypothetical protein SO802_015619 [Lithocarpus litseifolius]|uniref:Uncharacterized protein n=1 Tax=Lithocarpus litseifolius TaxID=425828 RepID=A0AAW2CWJ4_9ROSI